MCKHPGYKDNLYKTDQDEAFRINIPALTLNEVKKRICQPRLTYPLLLSKPIIGFGFIFQHAYLPYSRLAAYLSFIHILLIKRIERTAIKAMCAHIALIQSYSLHDCLKL